ncbi:uncharacterized protein LOC113798318 isoform X2 [Dermatophagoides pteronyssinus]|uniref:uncharacterized protein LOC113798318 isoform X2 n=1 Tax=Dermatophagoides pteronyssinus TaxID=6956 RepID=UPI003F667913
MSPTTGQSSSLSSSPSSVNQPSTSSSSISNHSDDHHYQQQQQQQLYQQQQQDPYQFYPYSFYHNNNPNNDNQQQQQQLLQQQQQHDEYEKIDLLGQPTTLYQNRSVSIINSKAEQRLRDQIMNKQQLFLQQNQCVDSKELKQFIKSVIITYDKGVNLALLNDLVDTMLMTNNDGQSVNNNNDLMKKNVSKMIVENIIQDNNPENVIEEIIVTEQRKQPVIKQQQQQQLKSEQSEEEGQRVKTSTLIVPVQMSNWEFGSSMTYVASVVTTIGYGHVTPITNEGKILTIVFGAISIPCTLLFLSIIISMIRDGPIKQIEVWLIKLFGYFTDEITLLKIRFLHLFIVTIVLFSALIILPAFLFKQMESQWTFLDSFYYCFITITTVGLGDYVPGQNSMQENRTWYLISIVIYMYFGLCLMMLWIALVLRIPYFNFKTFLVIEEPELLERKLINEQLRNQQRCQHQSMDDDVTDDDDDDNEKTPLVTSTSSPPSYSLMMNMAASTSRSSSASSASSLMNNPIASTSASPPSTSSSSGLSHLHPSSSSSTFNHNHHHHHHQQQNRTLMLTTTINQENHRHINNNNNNNFV